MSRITLVGIDPGLVHSGAVALHIDEVTLAWSWTAEALPGNDPVSIKEFIERQHADHIFVEAYRERGQVYSTNTAMRQLLYNIKQLVRQAQVLDNTGVKKVVTDDLMKLLDVWTFSIKTHHQDLRSAARIALYGAVKNDELNQLITRVVMRQLGLTTP